MKKLNLLITLIFPVVAFTQPTPSVEALYKRKQQLQQELIQNKELLKNKSSLRKKTLESVISMNKRLTTLRPEKKKILRDIAVNIENELSKTQIPLLEQRKFTKYRDQNRYRSFLKCLRRNLSAGYDGFDAKIPTCNLQKARNFKASESFLKDLNVARETLSIDQFALQKKSFDAQNEIQKLDKQIRQINKNLESLEVNFEQAKIKYKREKFYSINKNFLNCNAKTPTIDLENSKIHSQSNKTGPFYNIPRDHQDGVGTCFANTAKNLLLGLSDGQMNASFLDMALKYKNAITQKEAFDLDGGLSCEVLDLIKDEGYCPKGFSPIESGDDTYKVGGLFNKSGGLYNQAEVIAMLKRFMNDKSVLENKTDACSANLVKRSKEIVSELKNNSKIKLPYPQIEKFFLDEERMRGFYTWSYKDKVPNPVSEEDFLNDYHKVNKEFLTSYLEAAIRNDSPEKLLERFNNTFRKFFEKYKIADKLNESFYQSRLSSFLSKEYDQTFKDEALHTNIFYKKFFNANSDTINLSDSSCMKDKGLMSSFLDGLSEIANLFRSTGGNVNALFDSEGNFISNHDLLSLAVAPKCLNTKNRIKPEIDFSCKRIRTDHSIDLEKEIKDKRELILMSLLEGLPVGNSHPQPGGSHINTIVGFRFNSSTNKCEYKIRESQSATSFWTSEREIIKINDSFTVTEKPE